MSKKLKMRYCFNCGEEIGFVDYYEPLDTCGKLQCERVARELAQEEREIAHEKLDKDIGW